VNSVDHYLKAAERTNTLLSYASTTRHFEEEWKDQLAASSDAIVNSKSALLAPNTAG
jgi:hypothetical protein